MRVKLTQAEIDALIDLARYVLQEEPSGFWSATRRPLERGAAARALATLRRAREDQPTEQTNERTV